MPDIQLAKPGSTTELMEKLRSAKHNPSLMHHHFYDQLSQMSEGKIEVVNPMNPMTLLMDWMVTSTHLAIEESLNVLPQIYPSRSDNINHLYHHMVNKDYLSRFAQPCETVFEFLLPLNEFNTRLVFDNTTRSYKGIIPRDTFITVDGYTFTSRYPIIIERFEHGAVQVSYDTNIQNPIASIPGNIIRYDVRKVPNGETVLFIPVVMDQVAIVSHTKIVEATGVFRTVIPFTDDFYHARVFIDRSGKWEEIYTTHSDQTYDINKATAVLKLLDNSLEIYIPHIYQVSGIIRGKLRIDVYSTKGEMSVDFSNYPAESFNLQMRSIDEVNEINDFTNVWANTSLTAICDRRVEGGRKALTYNELRERMITNVQSPSEIPITPSQIRTHMFDKGFDIIERTDALTRRILLAIKDLPRPVNTKLLTSVAYGMQSFKTSAYNLVANGSAVRNQDRITLFSNNLFRLDNNIATLVPPHEVEYMLKHMTVEELAIDVNTGRYAYSPFYYVYDRSELEFQARAYHLDDPKLYAQNFVRQNHSLQLTVNIGNYAINKTTYGYEILVTTFSGSFYKQLEDSNVGLQLAFKPSGEDSNAYINGELIGRTEEDERIYSFKLITSHEIDKDNRIAILNSKMFGMEDIRVWMDLEQTIHFYHVTDSITNIYKKDETDDKIAKFMYPSGFVGNTHETLDISLGKSLDALWKRNRSMASGLEYRVHPIDVPRRWSQDVYEINPVTGGHIFIEDDKPVRHKLYNMGDIIIDEETGEPLLLHKAGDPFLDEEGRPVNEGELSVDYEVDLLLIDGALFFVNDIAYNEYRTELVRLISKWVVDDIGNGIGDRLENTDLYFYPISTIGYVANDSEEMLELLPSQLSLKILIILNQDRYNEIGIRSSLEESTIERINEIINRSSFSLKELEDTVVSVFGTGTLGVNITGLRGSKEEILYINIKDVTTRLTLKKNIVVQSDKTTILKEAVEFEYRKGN